MVHRLQSLLACRAQPEAQTHTQTEPCRLVSSEFALARAGLTGNDSARLSVLPTDARMKLELDAREALRLCCLFVLLLSQRPQFIAMQRQRVEDLDRTDEVHRMQILSSLHDLFVAHELRQLAQIRGDFCHVAWSSPAIVSPNSASRRQHDLHDRDEIAPASSLVRCVFAAVYDLNGFWSLRLNDSALRRSSVFFWNAGVHEFAPLSAYDVARRLSEFRRIAQRDKLNQDATSLALRSIQASC